MQSETTLRTKAMEVLVDNLGIVDAERFISIIKRDKFDYTEWQRDLYKNESIEEIYNKAVEFQKQKREKK
jgi:hypothetical protein